MSHREIVNECEALGLVVRRVPSEGRRNWEGNGQGVRVYWSNSSTGDDYGLLGLPRVVARGVDTHARSIKEMRYLVTL
jgi:hypothetical protein